MGCLVVPLLITLGMAFIGGRAFYAMRAPVHVVEAQLGELRDGQIDKAYARLSASYRAKLSRDAFADLVEKHVTLRDNKSASFENQSLMNDEMTLAGTLTARSGTPEFVTFELVRENGEWKITAIRFDLGPKGEKL